MSHKQPYQFQRPAQKPANVVDESRAAELEQRTEALGNGQVLDEPASLQADNAASSQAVEPAAPQARSAAKSRARKVAPSAARSGTQAAPYTRADGQATRSTTVHIEIDLHRKLRVAAAELDVHMSAIVDEALRDWMRAKRR